MTILSLERDHEEFDAYVYDMLDVFKDMGLEKINQDAYDRCKRIFGMLEMDTMHHTQVENTKLHIIAREKYNTLCA